MFLTYRLFNFLTHEQVVDKRNLAIFLDAQPRAYLTIVYKYLNLNVFALRNRLLRQIRAALASDLL